MLSPDCGLLTDRVVNGTLYVSLSRIPPLRMLEAEFGAQAGREEDNPVVRNPITRPVQHKVLIVDDERLVANTPVILFKSAGSDARAASSAEEALELIADWCGLGYP